MQTRPLSLSRPLKTSQEEVRASCPPAMQGHLELQLRSAAAAAAAEAGTQDAGGFGGGFSRRWCELRGQVFSYAKLQSTSREGSLDLIDGAHEPFGESSVILLHPPLPVVGVSIWMGSLDLIDGAQ